MVGDDDDCPLETNAAAEGDVARDRQVVQLQDVRNWRKTLQEIADLKKG